MTNYFTVNSQEVSAFLPMSRAEMDRFDHSIVEISKKEQDSKDWLESVSAKVKTMNEKIIDGWRDIAREVNYAILDNVLKQMLESGEIYFVVNVNGEKRNMARTRISFAKSET